jgi:hypothetical protein
VRIMALVLGVVFSLVSIPAVQAQPVITNYEFFAVSLSGAFEVPENSSTNTGLVSLHYPPPLDGTNVIFLPGGPPGFSNVITIFTNDTVVDWRVSLAPDFPAVSAGVYGPAPPGQTGPLIFDLGQPRPTTNVFVVIAWPTNSPPLTNFTLDFAASSVFTISQMRQLEAGRFYVEVASSNYPGGEMRRQITKLPVLSRPQIQNDGQTSFKVSACPLYDYNVEVSSNLVQWSALTNVNTWDGLFTITDAEATNGLTRFYRVGMAL